MPSALTPFSSAPIIRHSLATPLTNIILNAEIAQEQLQQKPNHPADLYLQQVLLNARRVQSFLALADAPATVKFSVKAALTELLLLNEHSVLKKHLVSRMALSQRAVLNGNKFSFQEMIICLLNNAFESYPANQVNKLVFLTAETKRTGLRVAVIDGGSGMNWFQQKLCMTQNYSTKRAHQGLGLPFVKKTIEQFFHGRLTITSRPRRGTTISLYFPWRNNQVVAETPTSLEY